MRLSLQPFRPIALTVALAASLLAAGCTTIPDPVTLQERIEGKAVPMHKVLVVVDYGLDVRAMGTGRIEEFLAKLYSNVGETMAEAVTAAGGEPTVAYVRYSDELPAATGEYSHVWVQQVTRLRGYGQGSRQLSRQREWRSSIRHRSAPNAPLTPAYDARYTSDGVVCFTPVGLGVQFANRTECQERFRAAVASQLRKYQQGQ